jgi:hypothetical protein
MPSMCVDSESPAGHCILAHGLLARDSERAESHLAKQVLDALRLILVRGR